MTDVCVGHLIGYHIFSILTKEKDPVLLMKYLYILLVPSVPLVFACSLML